MFAGPPQSIIIRGFPLFNNLSIMISVTGFQNFNRLFNVKSFSKLSARFKSSTPCFVQVLKFPLELLIPVQLFISQKIFFKEAGTPPDFFEKESP